MDSIIKLINIFRNFPTVGPRTAGRFVYYLIKLPKQNIDEIILAINELKNKIKLCEFCFNPFEDPSFAEGLDGESQKNKFCQICKNQSRNRNILCIVEKETDLTTIENTKKYNGLYFILGGVIATMRKEDISQIRIEQLKKIISENNFTEIIVALNPTPEGKATSVFIESAIKEIKSSFKITHLARGIPVGGELEYADEETLESALEGRK